MNSPRHNATNQHHRTTTNGGCGVARTATTPGTATTATTAATHNIKQQQQQLFHQAASQNAPCPASMPAPAHKKKNHRQQQQQLQQKKKNVTWHGYSVAASGDSGSPPSGPEQQKCTPVTNNKDNDNNSKNNDNNSKNNIYSDNNTTHSSARNCNVPCNSTIQQPCRPQGTDNSKNGAHRATNAIAQPSARDELAFCSKKKKRRKMRTQEGLPTDASGHNQVFGVSWRPSPCSCAGHVLEKLVPQGGSGLLIAAR